jgi:hypothetical protein
MLARSLLFAALVASAAAGCDKVSDENLDKWTHTEKGPDKLKHAFADESIDPDLAAHAGANMVKKGMEGDVRTELEAMSAARRTQVTGKLAPRLWELARVEREDVLPSGGQIAAKDMLVVLRKYADDAGKGQIDSYLVDWYGVKSYEARAQAGGHLGPEVMRLIGPAGGKKLVELLNSLIAAPGQEKVKNRIGDQLIIGIAASGSPDGVKALIELIKTDHGDATLPTRAMNALFATYVNPRGQFEIRTAEPLAPFVDTFAGIAETESMPQGVPDDAVSLIAAVGAPACIKPLVAMVSYPNSAPRFKYAAANNALHCGGLASVHDVVHALPDVPYAQLDLKGSVAGEIALMTPRDQVLAVVRELLTDKNKIARWTAVETLLVMKSVEDAPKLAAMAGDKELLVGFFGDQSGVPAKDRKTDPTVGQRAKEVAGMLTSGK